MCLYNTYCNEIHQDFQGARLFSVRSLHMLKGKIFHYLTSKAYTLVTLQLFEIIQRLCGKVYHGGKDSTLIFIVKKIKEKMDMAYHSMS